MGFILGSPYFGKLTKGFPKMLGRCLGLGQGIGRAGAGAALQYRGALHGGFTKTRDTILGVPIMRVIIL